MEGMPPPWLQPLRPSRKWWLRWAEARPETQRFVPGPDSLLALAIEGAQAVVPEGSDRSSRVARVLSFPCPAGAADRTGQYETLCTLSPPFRFG